MAELTFSLHVEAKDKESYLVLHVQDKAFPSRIVYADALKRPEAKEKELYLFLYKEHFKSLGISPLSDRASHVSIQKIRIPSIKALECIKLLSLAKKLHWKGSALFFNPLSTANAHFIAKEEENGSLLVTYECLIDGRVVPFSAVDLFFPSDPPWCIAQGCVFSFSAEVDRHLLMKMYKEPLVLEGKKKEQFIELYKEEDEEGPTILWQLKGVSLEDKQEGALEALPVLVLHDTHGAFASLFMDYGTRGMVPYHEIAGAFRNRELEKSWEKDLLETGYQKKALGSSHYYCPLDQVTKTLSFLLELGWKILDSKGRAVYRYTASSLDIGMGSTHITARGTLSYQDHEVNVQNVMGSFLRRDRFVEISPFAVGLMDDAALGDLAPFEEGEVSSEGIKMKSCKAALLGQLWNKEGCRFDKGALDLVQRMEGAASIELAPVSELFCGSLYPYQQEGVNWLHFLHRSSLSGLLADDMGLGKTVQVLAFISHLPRAVGPICIIAPTSLLFNWKREFEKFLPSYSVYLHQGKERLALSEEIAKQEIIITSYAFLRIDRSIFEKVHFYSVILDEAQAIKNPQSQVAMSAFSLRSDMRIAITGTPVENRWDDLWSLFHFLEPMLLGDKKEFHAQMLSAQVDDRYLKKIRRKIRPFILRRTKEMVALDLPEKILQTVFIQMTDPQRALYEKYVARNRSGLIKELEKEGTAARRLQILEALLRLRQICCHPHLAEKDLPKDEEMSGKLERLLSDIEQVVAEGKKVIVFSQFTQMLQLIKEHIKQTGISPAYLDGSTEDREGVVKSFQEDPSVQVFLMSLKAGGVGLNLTAADYVFLCDPWWNDATERQAIDRAYRLGRKDVVVARRYVMAESVEEKMMKLKQQKTALADGLMETEGELSSFTMQEIAQMLC